MKETNPEVTLVPIPAGTFSMGSPGAEPEREDDEIPHEVTVRSFCLGKNPVTSKEYEEVMGLNPSYFEEPDLPAESVSWYDAIKFCNTLSIREGLTPAYGINESGATWDRKAPGYRLPTEAEWEYACRAGTTTPFHTGENITTSQANYDGDFPYNGNAKGIYRAEPWAAGRGAVNAWGLYDMPGNVEEWCWDWYAPYSAADQTDPPGPGFGFDRVLRGGCWAAPGRCVRSAYRSKFDPGARSHLIGFRLARSGGLPGRSFLAGSLS
ncbi:MAG: formylglycine-generating enzyme family protein [Spirochaetaceae bacterium]|jgi:formylglycine-generating enzyme required for sulfatase activity|nr:formylglycine-generating enzyme family protein [Spirochaetaceae bacterium]